MNARHVSRELFVLVLSQLPNIKKKVEKLQVYDLIEQASRTLTNEVSSILSNARGELVKADQELLESTLLAKPQTIRDTLRRGMDNTHNALELVAYCNQLPLFCVLSEKTEIRDFTVKLLKLYQENSEKIDKIIEESVAGWSMETMYTLDRNAIILAVIELKYYENTSHKIAIDEAVEIAKKFGSEDSPGFVNGVLSKVLKTLGIEEAKSRK